MALFCASEWEFYFKPGSDLGHLTEAHALRSFEGIRGRFEHLALASLFNELLMKTTLAGQNASELFRLHSNALAILDESQSLVKDLELKLLNSFLAKFLQWSGHQPSVLKCMHCEKLLQEVRESRLSIDVESAAWSCTEELPGRETLETLSIKDLALGLGLPMKHAVASMESSEIALGELSQYLLKVLQFHIPGMDQLNFHSLRFLKSNAQLPKEYSQ